MARARRQRLSDHDAALLMIDTAWKACKAPGGYGIVGAPAMAQRTGLSKSRIYELMPLAVKLSGQVHAGYRLVINNKDRTYRMVNKLSSDDRRTVAGLLKGGETKWNRFADSVDVKHATPQEELLGMLARNLTTQSETLIKAALKWAAT